MFKEHLRGVHCIFYSMLIKSLNLLHTSGHLTSVYYEIIQWLWSIVNIQDICNV